MESLNIVGAATLPWGDKYLCWGDDMGLDILTGRSPFEVKEQRFLLKHLEEGMVFYDVGAHHGLYTLLASYKVGEPGLVVAFEPSGRERAVLKRNVEATGRRNVRIEPSAASDYDGVGELHSLSYGTGLNYLARSLDGRGVNVNTLRVDTYTATNPPPSVIKMDVEGSEVFALRGAEETLKQHKPLLLVELHEDHANRLGYSATETRSYVERLGYTWKQADEEGGLTEPDWGRRLSHTLFAVPT